MRVYLDHNATAPIRPEARAAMMAALDLPGNAQSVHSEGRRARSLIEAARAQIAALIGARSQDVVFTSGGSEANALALRGALQGAAAAGERVTRLIASAIEHESIRANARACEETIPGLRVLECPVTSDGVVNVTELRRLLMEGKGRALISIMAANNETGVIQPLGEVVGVARSHGALLHCDAVQATGRIPFSASDFDYVTLSAHKLGGPQGIGALIVRDGVPFAPQILGGGQEQGRRAGTENVAAIAGFGAAAAAAKPNADHLRWRQALERKLIGAVDGTVVVGATTERLPNTICVAVPAVPSENMVIALDLDSFAVSAGAACSSGKVTRSHVLTAMGVDPHVAASAIRVSFGWNTTEEELNAFAEAWTRIVKRAASRAAA